MAQEKLWLLFWLKGIWHELRGLKSAASDHYKTIWQRWLEKCPQNKNIFFSSKIFNLRCLHRMNSILVAGALSLMSSRIMNYELVMELVCGLCGWARPEGYHILQHFFFAKPCFLEFIWIFSGTNDLKINISHILNPNLTKKIPLNTAHHNLSNNTKGTFHFVRNFQLQFNLIFSVDIIQY
jgi:hypothetical protein